jgi:short-subunit dehydrogenase
MHAARSLLRIVFSLLSITFAFAAHANDEYQGKVAVITGSSYGLGMELAKIAADKKMKLVLADIRPDPSKAFAETVKKNGGEAIVVEVDLAVAEQRPRVIDAAMKQFGRIDYLFNNAGYNYIATVEQIELKEAHRLFEVNYWAYLDLAQRSIPIMKKQGSGTIVSTASIMGHMPGSPSNSQYSATKHAVVALFQAMEQEVKPLGIRVRIASPGGMRTNIAKFSVGPGAEGRRTRADAWEHPEVAAREIFEQIPSNEVVIYPGSMAKGMRGRN